MGMNVGGHSGGVQSEINVTPLIDVLLVLLIIFIVIMPIMVQSEALEVPREAEINTVMETAPLTVMIKNDLAVVVGDGEHEIAVAASDLPRVLGTKLATTTQKVVFVDFEEGVPWREVVGAMDTVRGLATDPNHEAITVALKLDGPRP
ncbi:MAG: biopolymer transporter ExbD [Kofleriaceae bacterium]